MVLVARGGGLQVVCIDHWKEMKCLCEHASPFFNRLVFSIRDIRK